ncbi:MAG TPA: NAD(P)-binding protein [Acidimicrobiales bacterium]|nr:NAD(P)-binding protein [Acidimicrobiales bacterium]
MERHWDVIVVGAGLAGLAAAATAAGTGASVLVLDGQRPGGRASTDELNGYRFNRGAHAFFRAGSGRGVLERLGVRVRGASPILDGARVRRGERVGALGLRPAGIARSRMLTTGDKARIARVFTGAPRWKPATLADRSAAAWFDELGLAGGAREFAEMLARTATYVVDMAGVSADLVAAQIQMALQDGVEYLHGGWSTMVDGLAGAARRRGAEIHAGARVRLVAPDGGRVRVAVAANGASHDRDDESGAISDGGTLLARRAVIAAGTPAACAALLPDRPPAWNDLGAPARAACLDIGFASPPDMTVLLGLDRPLYLIRHCPPAALAPPGGSVVHGLRYLRPDEDPSPDAARAELIEHARVAGIDPTAAAHVRYLHRMTVVGAVPVPGVGLAGRVDVGATGHDGVLVAGDWVGPRGHLADAALASGEDAGRLAVAALERDPVVGRAS